MLQFLCRFAFFINFSSFKPDTENNAKLRLTLPVNMAPLSKDKILIKSL